MRLKDKVAIVTGAGSGFGAGIARRFQNFGFTPGVVPQGPSLGAMSELTNLLLRALDVRDQVAAAR